MGCSLCHHTLGTESIVCTGRIVCACSEGRGRASTPTCLPERLRNDTATTTPAAFRMQAEARGLWESKVTVHGVTGERLLETLITNSSGFPTVCSEPRLFEDSRQVNNPVEEPEGRLWHSCYMDDQTDNYPASPPPILLPLPLQAGLHHFPAFSAYL